MSFRDPADGARAGTVPAAEPGATGFVSAPRGFRHWAIRVGVAVAAIGAITGVAVTLVVVTGQETPLEPGAIILPTSTWDGGPGMAAIVGGYVLQDERGCLRFYSEPTVDPEAGWPILWPKGYTAIEVRGVLVVRNADRVEVVREGEVLSATGGTGPVREPQPGCEHVPLDGWSHIQELLPAP